MRHYPPRPHCKASRTPARRAGACRTRTYALRMARGRPLRVYECSHGWQSMMMDVVNSRRSVIGLSSRSAANRTQLRAASSQTLFIISFLAWCASLRHSAALARYLSALDPIRIPPYTIYIQLGRQGSGSRIGKGWMHAQRYSCWDVKSLRFFDGPPVAHGTARANGLRSTSGLIRRLRRR
jgi:hypothetical protein